MSFTPITVTGLYKNQDGSAASGNVSFRLSSPLIDGSTNEMRVPVPIIVDLSALGAISAALTATDDPTSTPTGVTYRVIERISGAAFRSYSIEVPFDSAGGTLDLADVAPVTDATITYGILPSAVPGGELGGTYGVPTVDALHGGSTHAATQASAEATAAAAAAAHAAAADPHGGYLLESGVPDGTAGAPSIKPASEPTTGFSFAAGLIRASIAAVGERIKLTATELLVSAGLRVTGNVTIGGPRPWYDVTSAAFGAVGDGTTNDSTAIQAAIDAAKAAGGGTVFFPKMTGDYIINTGLTVDVAADTHLPIRFLFAGGARIKTNSAITMLLIRCTAGAGMNVRRLSFENLYFYSTVSGATMIQMRKAAYCHFTNIELSGDGCTAIDLGTGDGSDLHNQFTNTRITHIGRGLVVNGFYNIFTNVVVAEGITGADAINVLGAGNVIDGFAVNGAGGTGGTAAVDIRGEGTILANGRIFNSYIGGLIVTGVRYVKVMGVTINGSQTFGLRLSGTLQGRFEVTCENSSAAGAGLHDHILANNTPTDNVVIAQFVGTNALWDINENSGTNNVFITGTLPNGVTNQASSTVVAAGQTLAGSGGLGYHTGAGGAVTQITSAATAVTLNTVCGRVTTVALTTAAGAEERFTVNNTKVAATDCITLGTTYNGAGTPAVTVLKVGANLFDIVITNLHATNALDAVMVINFAVIKAVAA